MPNSRGRYQSSPVTLSNGDTADLLLDSAGKLLVNSGSTAEAALADATVNPTTSIGGALVEWFNGTTWDRARSGILTAVTGALGYANVVPCGVYTTSLPALTTGQTVAIQLDASGRIIIAPGTVATSNFAQITDGITGPVKVLAASTGVARTDKALVMAPSINTPWTTVNQSTLANSFVGLASAGMIGAAMVQVGQSLATQVLYIMIIDAASAVNGAGKTLLYPPIEVVHVSGSTDTIDLPLLRKVATTGITIAASSTSGTTLTLIASAITGSVEVAA